MPTYSFVNKSTGVEWEEFMTISEGETFLRENPDCEILITGAPAICDPTRVGVRSKPDNGFRDVLKTIKGKHRRSTINTF